MDVNTLIDLASQPWYSGAVGQRDPTLPRVIPSQGQPVAIAPVQEAPEAVGGGGFFNWLTTPNPEGGWKEAARLALMHMPFQIGNATRGKHPFTLASVLGPMQEANQQRTDVNALHQANPDIFGGADLAQVRNLSPKALAMLIATGKDRSTPLGETGLLDTLFPQRTEIKDVWPEGEDAQGPPMLSRVPVPLSSEEQTRRDRLAKIPIGRSQASSLLIDAQKERRQLEHDDAYRQSIERLTGESIPANTPKEGVTRIYDNWKAERGETRRGDEWDRRQTVLDDNRAKTQRSHELWMEKFRFAHEERAAGRAATDSDRKRLEGLQKEYRDTLNHERVELQKRIEGLESQAFKMPAQEETLAHMRARKQELDVMYSDLLRAAMTGGGTGAPGNAPPTPNLSLKQRYQR